MCKGEEELVCAIKGEEEEKDGKKKARNETKVEVRVEKGKEN